MDSGREKVRRYTVHSLTKGDFSFLKVRPERLYWAGAGGGREVENGPQGERNRFYIPKFNSAHK